MRPLVKTVPRSEHISLESDSSESSTRRAARGPFRIRTRLHWRNTLRGIEARFDLADDHHVQVRYLKPRRLAKQYTVDLRFFDARPRRIRHVAWAMLLLSLLLTLTGVAALLLSREGLESSRHLVTAAGVLAFTGAVAAFLLFLHRTTESLEFLTVHGEAPLIRITGGVGSGRKAKAFCIELIKSIHLAHLNMDISSQSYLRDEMREHYRLHAAGALSDAQYEACKRRILAAHSA